MEQNRHAQNGSRQPNANNNVKQLVRYLQSQLGSRKIQSWARDLHTPMEVTNASGKKKKRITPFDTLLEILAWNMKLLATDQFANYAVQELMKAAPTEAQKLRLVQGLRGHFAELSIDKFGCRVVDTALDFCRGEEMYIFCVELSGNLYKCCIDQNGNHIVQKVIEWISLNVTSQLRDGAFHVLAQAFAPILQELSVDRYYSLLFVVELNTLYDFGYVLILNVSRIIDRSKLRITSGSIDFFATYTFAITCLLNAVNRLTATFTISTDNLLQIRLPCPPDGL